MVQLSAYPIGRLTSSPHRGAPMKRRSVSTSSTPASTWVRLILVGVLFLSSLVTALSWSGTAAASPPPAHGGQPDFGPNVKIFDPSMPVADIQAAVDAIRDKQVDNEMGTDRYALLFKPGTYGSAAQPLIIQVGYYTEVAGLASTRPTSRSTVMSTCTTGACPVPAASRWTTSGARCRTSRSTSWAAPMAAAPRPTSGRRHRRRRCGG